MTLREATIADIGKFDGETVSLKGWVANVRSSGSIHFILLRDGTGVIQGVVLKNEVSPELFALADSLTHESSVQATGLVRNDRRAPGGYELTIKDLQVIAVAKEYPIAPKEHGVDFLMDRRHLWLRSSRQHTIMKIRHTIIKAIRDFLDSRGFVLIDAPILTPAACEGTTTLFETQYFDEKAYLTQSGQLYMEAGAMAFGKVYCFGPTFRAEKSKTRRHLMEFWMVEPEMAFCDLDQDMAVQEEMVTFIAQTVLSQHEEDLEKIGRDVEPLKRVVPPFPRISYDEALEILRKKVQEVVWGNDFGGTDETILAEEFDRPVFVHRFPSVCKAFYMKRDPDNPEVALGADLLAPEGYGEIIGGGQREDDLEILEGRMAELGMDSTPYQWYLDLRRYGSVPHAGFGLGIERTVSWICGLEHVRETIPFPRMLTRIYP